MENTDNKSQSLSTQLLSLQDTLNDMLSIMEFYHTAIYAIIEQEDLDSLKKKHELILMGDSSLKTGQTLKDELSDILS